MHFVNKVLSFAGIRLSRVSKTLATPGFISAYNKNLELCKQNARGFIVFKEFYYEAGEHPASFVDFECSFAAQYLYRSKPTNILDVGSYRPFILGLLGGYQVTTVDVRERKRTVENESVVSTDGKSLNLDDNSFDAVVSLSAIEHFGLGRYGDDFDLDADKKAVREMARVLKPGGSLILTTSITRAHPSIAFNGHRIYSRDMIQTLRGDLVAQEERFFSHTLGDYCSFEQITDRPKKWDVYLGCWTKP